MVEAISMFGWTIIILIAIAVLYSITKGPRGRK